MGGKPFLICFTGIDGAGKTSHARKLARYLDEMGVPTRYVWNRYDPFFIKPFVVIGRKLFMNNADMTTDYRAYREAKKKVLRKKLIAAPFLTLFLLEYMVHALFKVKLPALRGKNIICDRYTYDVIVSVANDFNYSRTFISRAFRMYWLVLPRPDLTFLLDLPADIAFSRKDDTVSLPHLERQREEYRRLAEDAGAIMLDGLRDLKELEAIVQEKVQHLVNGRAEKR